MWSCGRWWSLKNAESHDEVMSSHEEVVAKMSHKVELQKWYAQKVSCEKKWAVKISGAYVKEFLNGHMN